MKVGILTLPYEPNYGWAVQLWALYHIIEKLGHEPVVINRRWNNTEKSPIISFKRFLYYNVICRRFSKFLNIEIHNKTSIIRCSESMKIISENFDAIIVGSDQVWRIENTRGVDLNFFCDFVSNPKIRKISYAASFGKDTWQGNLEETQNVAKLLHGFYSISVRESSGVQLCRDLFGVNAINVLDPTLLLNSEDYNLLLSNPKEKNQITSYILDSTEEKIRTINLISEHYKASLVSLFPKHQITYYKSVYNWLENIRDARCVIVDSFHGMVFSIIFHKNFVVLANNKRGLTRFVSLLSQLGIEDRLTFDFSYKNVISILSRKIDYSSVDIKLSNLQNLSLDFIKKSLN